MLGRIIIEEYVRLAVSYEDAKEITSIWDARDILDRIGMGELNPSMQAQGGYVKNLQRAEYEHEGDDELGTMKELEEQITPKKKIEDLDDEQKLAIAEMEERKREKREQRERERKLISGEISAGIPLADAPHEDKWPKDENETVNEND